MDIKPYSDWTRHRQIDGVKHDAFGLEYCKSIGAFQPNASHVQRYIYMCRRRCDVGASNLVKKFNVKSNHYGRCYPIRVNIRKGIVPVLIRSWRTRAYTTVFWIFWLLKRLNPVVCIIIKLTMKGYSDWSRQRHFDVIKHIALAEEHV